jgi:hypothetical protein
MSKVMHNGRDAEILVTAKWLAANLDNLGIRLADARKVTVTRSRTSLARARNHERSWSDLGNREILPIGRPGGAVQ